PLHPVYPLFPYTTLFRSRSSISRFQNGSVPTAWYGGGGGGGGVRQPLSSVASDRADHLLTASWLVSQMPSPPRPSPRSGCRRGRDRKSTRLNSSHVAISY